MAGGKLIQVYQKPYLRNYFTPKFSCAYIWKIISNLLVVLVSLFITFASQGLWRRTGTYVEQACITFTDRFALGIADSNGSLHFWTAFDECNSKLNENTQKLITPSFHARHIDRNADGKTDEIQIEIYLRFLDNDTITFQPNSVFYVLEFNWIIENRVILEGRNRIVGEAERKRNGEVLTVWADLHIAQRRTLPSYGHMDPRVEKNFREKSSADETINILNDEVGRENLLLTTQNQISCLMEEIQENNFLQNYTLELLAKSENWKQLSVSSIVNSFATRFYLNINEQTFFYRAGAFELLKWAWIQYLCVFVIVQHVMSRVDAFLYENHIFVTVMRSDIRDEKIN